MAFAPHRLFRRSPKSFPGLAPSMCLRAGWGHGSQSARRHMAGKGRTKSMARSQKSEQERAELLEKIKADFDARLAKLAADPAEWVSFIETVVSFGAQYTLNNQFLLLMQAEERQLDPTFFLPFGNKDGTSGWKK